MMPHKVFVMLTILLIVPGKLIAPMRANVTTETETSFEAIGK